jgi:hypothetical protein
MAQSAMDVSLRKFDMRKIPQDAVCVFIGKRRTGKSTLVKDLLFNHQDMPLGVVMSGTEESNSFYSKIVPLVEGSFNPQMLSNLVKRQKMMMSKIVEEKDAGQTRSRYDPRLMLILDDCMYDDNWTRDSNIRYIFMNGRHFKVFFLITMQYPLGIQPALRTNVDYVFILREPYLNNRKRIYENYASAFPSFEFFCQIMDQCTQNYECIVIDNTSQSNKLEDIVFWYKAEMHGDFRIGAPESWALSDSKRREHEGGQYDARAAARLKGPAVQVRKL